MDWFDLAADVFKDSVANTKKRVRSREFTTWRVWLREKWHRREPIHYYLAQIAYEIRRLNYDLREIDPSSLSISRFLVGFTTSTQPDATPRRSPASKKAEQADVPLAVLTEEQKAERLKNSKAAWGAFLRGAKTRPAKDKGDVRNRK